LRRAALIVFAKVPEQGTVKTRLTPLLTPTEAAQLYEAFLLDSLDAYRCLGADVRLYLAPSVRPVPEDFAPDETPRHTQRGEGLGARMLNAFVETFVAGYERVLIIGTDHPTLPLAFIERGFEELDSPFSIVLGPSDDGGFYLLGMNEVYPQLFEGMLYSHPEVLAQTLERAETTGAAVSVLPPWYDVDTPDALRRLVADLGSGSVVNEPRRTRELLASLCEKYEELV
jgi:rSAM/selenodomain-associated transferase 1